MKVIYIELLTFFVYSACCTLYFIGKFKEINKDVKRLESKIDEIKRIV